MRRFIVSKVLTSSRIPRSVKVLVLVGALAYAVIPLDLIPDFLAPLGIVDDTVLLLLSLWMLFKRPAPELTINEKT